MSSFPYKLHQLLTDIEDNEELSSIISWLPSGTGFKIHKPVVFETFLLTKYFPRQSKLKSFKRQVQYYGFDNLGRGSYSHPSFVRGKRNLCGKIIHKLPMRNVKTSKSSITTANNDLQQLKSTNSRSASPPVTGKVLYIPVLSNNLPLLSPQAFAMTPLASKGYEPSLAVKQVGINSSSLGMLSSQQQQQDAYMASFLDQLQQKQLQNRAMQQYLSILLSR